MGLQRIRAIKEAINFTLPVNLILGTDVKVWPNFHKWSPYHHNLKVNSNL